MSALLSVVVLVIAFKEDGATVYDDKIYATEGLYFITNYIELLRDFERALNEMHISSLDVEVHLRQSNPAHLRVSRVLRGQDQDSALIDFKIAERSAGINMRGKRQRYCSLAATGMAGKGVYVLPAKNALDQEIRRSELSCKYGTGFKKLPLVPLKRAGFGVLEFGLLSSKCSAAS
jgi:hypothetical protein